MSYYEYDSVPRPRKCLCGSGEVARWVNDAQGIPLAKVCGECEKEKLSGFRSEILTGYTQDDVNEPIEPDY